MGQNMAVDPVMLRQAGQALVSAASRLAEEWAAFSGRVQAMGQIFGDDDISSIIAISYDAAYGIADRAYSSAGDVLGGYGDTLVDMADSYERIEESNLGMFGKLY